jgi:energy-coupling factor transporter transmembrane protein EcfT
LRKAETTATSLECRAFGLYPTRTYVKDVQFNPWDLLLIVVTVVLSTGLIVIERIG